MFDKEIIKIDVDLEEIALDRLLRHILHHVRRIDRKLHEKHLPDAVEINQVPTKKNFGKRRTT